MSALPLSKLPSSCGYTVKSTHQDLVVVAPYDGCFVAQEVGRLTRLVFGSAWIVQLVLFPLLSGGRLRSSPALVGAVGEDVVSAGQTMFIQTSYSYLLRRGHGSENGMAPFRNLCKL